MAISSNRSQPSLPVRHNPHSRISSSEANSAVRRSFSGSPSPKPLPLTNPGRIFCPTTPANSPADSGTRDLQVREEITTSWDCAEKENEKAAKIRSPAKGSSKNFMSPTISATSKFSPSPKKRVLGERNEPVRTSISLCDGKATFFSSISSDPTDYSKPKSETLPVTKPLRKVTFTEVPLDNALSDTVVIDSDSFCNETCSKNINSFSTVSPSTALAPLDADPSPKPYDPKTNYLSPRPQFLHYRPNPRTEVLRRMDMGSDIVGEPKHLDESLMAAIVPEDSDSESQKDSDSSSSTVEEEVVEEPKSLAEEMVLEPEAEEAEGAEELSFPVSSPPAADKVAKEILDGKRPTKPRFRFFISSRLASAVLVLLIAYVSISVTDCPVLNGCGAKDFKLADLSYWGSHMSVLIQSAFNDHYKRFLSSSSLPTDELNPMQFTNSTCPRGGSIWEFQEDMWFKKLNKKPEENEFYNDVESEIFVKEAAEDEAKEEADSEIEATEVEYDPSFGDNQEMEFGEAEAIASEEEVDTGFVNSREIAVYSDVNKISDSDTSCGNQEKEEGEVYTDFGGDSREMSVLEEVKDAESERSTQAMFNHSDTSSGNQKQEDDDVVELDMPKPIDAHPEHVTTLGPNLDDSCSEVLESPAQMQQEVGFTKHYALGISSFFLVALAVAAVLIFLKQNKAVQCEPCFPKTEVNSFPAEESTSYSSKRDGRKGGKGSNRRESVATSSDYSVGSLSYGSFTTYEKIPIKHHGNGGDEVATPVRRSSRIRSHVTSP